MWPSGGHTLHLGCVAHMRANSRCVSCPFCRSGWFAEKRCLAMCARLRVALPETAPSYDTCSDPSPGSVAPPPPASVAPSVVSTLLWSRPDSDEVWCWAWGCARNPQRVPSGRRRSGRQGCGLGCDARGAVDTSGGRKARGETALGTDPPTLLERNIDNRHACSLLTQGDGGRAGRGEQRSKSYCTSGILTRGPTCQCPDFALACPCSLPRLASLAGMRPRFIPSLPLPGVQPCQTCTVAAQLPAPPNFLPRRPSCWPTRRVLPGLACEQLVRGHSARPVSGQAPMALAPAPALTGQQRPSAGRPHVPPLQQQCPHCPYPRPPCPSSS